MSNRRETRHQRDEEIDAVLRASRVLVAIAAGSLAEVDGILSLLQFRTLVIVATSQPCTLAGIAERLQVHPSNATRLVDKLVTGGFVRRREAAHDRRFLDITTTAKGSRLVDRVMDHRRAAIARLMTAMSPADRSVLSSAFAAFADAAGETDSAPEELVLSLSP